MSKNNNKEKSPSFWKKLGLGKHKRSVSSLKSDAHSVKDTHKNDTYSVKSKRFSSGAVLQPTPQEVQSPQVQPAPPLPPTPTSTITFKREIPSQSQQLVEPSQQGFSPSTSPKPTHRQVEQINHDATMVTLDTSIIPTPTDTTDLSQNKLNIIEDNQIIDNKPESIKQQKRESIISIKPEIINESKEESIIQTQVENATTFEDDNVTKSNDELMNIITNLKSELELEKATIIVLQKQKEAATKDLDYFELTVDELLSEKNDLIEQLEDEKIKSQQHLDDLNLLLQKMKSSADNARDQSFSTEQVKQELEAFQLKAFEEKEALLVEIKQKDKTIRELKAKLNKSLEQVDKLKESMDSLVKKHAEELERITKMNEENEKKLNSLLLHTPNGSPRIKPELETHQQEDEEESPKEIKPKKIKNRPTNIPKPKSHRQSNEDDSSSQYTLKMDSTISKSGDDMDDNDLDDQIMRLTKEKERLQSCYSKIPLTGGGPKSRKRKEDLEAMLDQVDSQLSKVKQRIRKN